MKINKIPFFSGLLGGILIIALFMVFVVFFTNLFNYNVKIINKTDIENYENYSCKIKLIDELKNDGVLLTPQEFTSNIVNYYNTALLILSAMLVIFSIIGYNHLKFLSNEKIDEKVKSDEFKERVSDSIVAIVEERSKEDLDLLKKDITELNDRIAKLYIAKARDNGEIIIDE